MSDLNIRSIIPAAGKLGGSRTIPGLAGLAEAKEKLDRLQGPRTVPRNMKSGKSPGTWCISTKKTTMQ